MKTDSTAVSALIERFFTERLIQQKRVSPHTIASYRDTFRLLFKFAQERLHTPPAELALRQLDAALISAFLNDLETHRSISARTRNLRLTAIRSFFRFVSFEEPALSAHVQSVLAIPSKRHQRKLVHFLDRAQIEALLAAPDQTTWVGRRDHALLLLAVQTGLRLSELTSLNRDSVALGRGAHVRCLGKGRKERCTPLTRQTVSTLRSWLKEPTLDGAQALFPAIHGARLSADAVQKLVDKHTRTACRTCPSLRQKHVTPHVLRHYLPFPTMSCSVTPAEF